MNRSEIQDRKLALRRGDCERGRRPLPYLNVFILPAYIVGALVAVWHAVRRGGQRLQYKDGAKLGFLSTFWAAWRRS
jgi:hypothetical protein